MGIVLPLEKTHVMEDELKILLAIASIPRFIEHLRGAAHAIGKQPRLVEPSVELALNADFRLRRETGAILKCLPGAAVDKSPRRLLVDRICNATQQNLSIIIGGVQCSLQCQQQGGESEKCNFFHQNNFEQLVFSISVPSHFHTTLPHALIRLKNATSSGFQRRVLRELCPVTETD